VIENLNGRVALLTGAGGGLGGHIARALAAHGVSVVLSDIEAGRPEGLINDLSGPNGATPFLAADLSDPEQAKVLVARAEEVAGPVDILVNNAGIEGSGSYYHLTVDEIQSVLNINLVSAALLTRSALAGMVERERGHIVSVSSIAGKMALAHLATYSASKYGLAALMRALSAEVDGYPEIGFSTVFPGMIRSSGMFADCYATGAWTPPKPLMRVITRPPEKVGAAVITAITTGKPEVLVSGTPVRLPSALHAVAPSLAIRAMRGPAKQSSASMFRAMGRPGMDEVGRR